MKRNVLLMTSVIFLGTAPVSVLAQTTDQPDNGPTQEQMFATANVSLQQATDLALSEVSGTLSAIGFNAENGMGVYEATVIGADGTSWTVKIDAGKGAVLASGQSALVDDENGNGNNGGDGHDGGAGDNSGESDNGGERGNGEGAETTD